MKDRQLTKAGLFATRYSQQEFEDMCLNKPEQPTPCTILGCNNDPKAQRYCKREDCPKQ